PSRQRLPTPGPQPIGSVQRCQGGTMKQLCMLGAMLIALATAGPVLADHGQSTDHSVATVQLGSGNASPAVSADIPANAEAPICVAATCSDQAGGQDDGGASAATNGGSGSSSDSSQTAEQSAGTVQVGSANVSPAAAVSAPVNADAPVCVLATCTTTSGGQQAGSSSATTNGTGPSQAGGSQNADQSVGTVQIGAVEVDPATAVSAPVNADAPGCVLSTCRSASGNQPRGGDTGGAG